MQKPVSLKVLPDSISFTVTETIHGKIPFQTSPSPSIAQMYSQGKSGLNHSSHVGVTAYWHPLTPPLLCVSHAEVPHALQRKRSIKGQRGKGETNWRRQSSDTD